MSFFFEDKLKDFNTEEIRKSAQNIIELTGTKAKDTVSFIKDKIDELDEDKKKMIIVGVSVFACVLIVAGVFYLLGKRAGRREAGDLEFDEWDS
ncbi:hypothetical protein [Butyrivibrio sp. WCE2006]|uniref:hypothetical protein n=1 Tax=Butyrivibrio sp. WCE2006 TaxID=1410611 RepID=UPI0005D17207|nr:hypothetical protein [Butyrivibrio sp. WCE2006]